MKMTPVTSSNIKAIGYNKLALELQVEFKSGKTFAYKYVSPSEYLDFLEADSVGKHFVQFIKPGREVFEVVKEAVKAVEVDSKSIAVTYTINGKQYTEFDINKRCAALEDKNLPDYQPARNSGYNIGDESFYIGYNPCNNWNDAGPIIDRCWDELMVVHVTDNYYARWECIMSEHNCTKLVAACICLIEVNGE
jgi:hypothetical protein